MSIFACFETYDVLVYHVRWSFYLFSTIGGLISARSGGKGSCVLKLGRRTSRVWKGRGASAGRGVSGVIRGGQRRGWKGTGVTRSELAGNMGGAMGGTLWFRVLEQRRWRARGDEGEKPESGTGQR